MRLRDRLFALFGRRPVEKAGQPRHRGPATHVIILDGTMSTLKPGCETHAGQLFKLLDEAGRSANLTVLYEAGIQWRDWRGTLDVALGRGINRQIQRAYGVLASRYRPGDSIVLAGYSRGAYAVRSLAGVIDLIGLVRNDAANVRNIRQAYRHYRAGARGPVAEMFRDTFCHAEVEIEAVAVWDTVKALGWRVPGLWRFGSDRHGFHNHALGRSVRHGFQALAHDETRQAYAPILWNCPDHADVHVEQVWFSGSHGDVGGQLNGYEPAEPLANIPLVWMLEKLESCGVALPQGWRRRFPCDPNAPSVGSWRGWGKMFLWRRRRVIGRDPSETIHPSVALRSSAKSGLFRRRSAG